MQSENTHGDAESTGPHWQGAVLSPSAEDICGDV